MSWDLLSREATSWSPKSAKSAGRVDHLWCHIGGVATVAVCERGSKGTELDARSQLATCFGAHATTQEAPPAGRRLLEKLQAATTAVVADERRCMNHSKGTRMSSLTSFVAQVNRGGER